MVKFGVIHGRFQGLHLGHIEYLLEGKKRCKHLVIGITNFEPYLNIEKLNDFDEKRNQKECNPFTFYERYKIIEGSLLENGVDRNEFDIVPFPIERPEYICNFVPGSKENTKFFVTIYDDWGYQKEKILRNMGFDVEVMWVRDYNQRITRGAEIRERIRAGMEWEHLVPKYMYNYVKENNIDERLKNNECFY